MLLALLAQCTPAAALSARVKPDVSCPMHATSNHCLYKECMHARDFVGVGQDYLLAILQLTHEFTCLPVLQCTAA